MRAWPISLLGILAAWALFPAGQTAGADPDVWGTDGPHYAVRYVAPVRPVGFFWHATTPAESYARGAAAMTLARGQYQVLTAQARIHAAEAARREMENRKRWVQTYFKLREMNREARAAEREPRSTPDQIVRCAQMDRPERLSPGELDKATGEISWPLVLEADQYEPYRVELEVLFADRAAGDIQALESHRIRHTTRAMLDQLRTEIGELPADEYIEARRFLESLAYEPRRPDQR